MSEAALDFRPQVIIPNHPDDEHVAFLRRAGLCLPTISCSEPLTTSAEPLGVVVNYASLAEGAGELELRLPINYDLTTSTVNSGPTVKIDRSKPSSEVTL